MKILLDTNAYSELRRGHPGVADWVRRSEQVGMSLIVVGELIYGFYRGSRLKQNLHDLNRFLDSPFVSILPMTMVTADRFGRIALQLRNKGTPIPTNDIWIAAQAQEMGADLLSFDLHFKKIDGLAWIHPE